jgi:hypothetical protein
VALRAHHVPAGRARHAAAGPRIILCFFNPVGGACLTKHKRQASQKLAPFCSQHNFPTASCCPIDSHT